MSRVGFWMIASLTGILALTLPGCERRPAADAPAGANTAAEHDHVAAGTHDHEGDAGEHAHEQEGAAEPANGEHAHAGHDHGPEDHGHHNGEAHELGTREAAGLTVRAVQFGPATSDAAELAFELEVEGAEAPTAVRMLIRNAEGAESLKVRANKIGDHLYDAHVSELPPNLTAGGVVIIEIETSAGVEIIEFNLER